MTPGQRLSARLSEIGWTRQQLCDLTGADPSLVGRWIAGTRTPTLDRAVAIERSPLAIEASAWVSVVDESGEHAAVDAPPRAVTG